MFKKIFFSSLSLLLLSGCGGGGGSSTDVLTSSSPQKTFEGKVIDGYIKNATVFIDLNNNSILDTGEIQTTSDELGNYKISIAENKLPTLFNIVSYGGVDISTSQAFNTVLKKVVHKDEATKDNYLTPSTTLISKLVANDLTTQKLSESKNEVALFLELDSSILEKDPIALFEEHQELYQQNLKVIETIKLINTLNNYTDSIENSNKNFDTLVKNISNGAKLKDMTSVIVNNQPQNISEPLAMINQTVESIPTPSKAGEKLTLIQSFIDSSLKSKDFYEAYTLSGSAIAKTFKSYLLKVYANQPLTSISSIPSSESKAIYGTINTLPTNALLKINATYPNQTLIVVKVYKEGKLLGLSTPKELLSSATSLDFGNILVMPQKIK